MTLTHSADVDLLISQHKWREALSALDSMSRSKSNGGAPLDDLTSLPRKCLCLAHLGRHREALQLVQVPLEKRRGWAAGWLAKAKVLLDLGRYQEALDCLEDDASGSKHLRRGSTRAIIGEAKNLKELLMQIRDSGANEHERGNQAYQYGEFYRASQHYERAIQTCQETTSEKAAFAGGMNQTNITLGALHSNLSACYFKLGHEDVACSQKFWEKALFHAQRCIQLRPGWEKGLGRKRDALSALGTIQGATPTPAPAATNHRDVNALGQTFNEFGLDHTRNNQKYQNNTKNECEHKEDDKLAGDDAFKRGDFALATKRYTQALASSAQNELSHPKAKIYSNRSASYAKQGQWIEALQDAQKALQLSPKWSKAWIRMGTSMQGLGNLLDAYCVYCKGLSACSEGKEQLLRYKLELLPLIPIRDTHICLSSSSSGQPNAFQTKCFQRFTMDASYPRESTRVFCISDVHIDQHGNLGWFKSLSNHNFSRDVLLIAGDVGDTMNAIKICLKEFKKRFRRVFLIPGNHDLWIRKDTSDAKVYPDSIAKLGAMHNICQELGVDMGPAEVAKGLFVVPLFSWYNHTFDEKHPHPGGLRYDSFCKWPENMSHLEVWKYMLQLNHTRVKCDYKDSYCKKHNLSSEASTCRSDQPYVFSMSHFLPRHELPFPWGVTEMAKAVGCKELDLQIQQIKADVHVFGHTHMDTDTTTGEKYVSDSKGGVMGLGSEKNHTRYVQSALDGGGSLYQLFGKNGLSGLRVDNQGKPT